MREKALGSIVLDRLCSRSWKWLSSNAGGLREQVLRGGVWLVLSDAATQAAGLLKMAVVARVLAPNDFGLFGIAVLVQRLVESFTETGVMAALIQKRGDVRPYLDTAWTLQVLRGTAVGLLLVVIAPLGGRFFGNPEAIAVIRCVGLSTFLWTLTNPATVHMRRDLRFRPDVAWRFAGVMMSLIAAILGAYCLRNAWALVWALIVGRLGEVLASYYVLPYRPTLRLRWGEARELMGFGRWMSLSNIAAFFENQVDSLGIAKFLGATQLGFYQIALQFANPFSRLGLHAHGVLFPAMSRLDNHEARRRALLSTVKVVSTALIPPALFIAVLAPWFVTLLFGPQWAPASPVLQGLLWATVARSLSTCTSPLLMSIGKPRQVVETQGLKLLIVLALLYPCILSAGVRGAAWAVAISCSIAALFQLARAAMAVGAAGLDLLLSFSGALLGSLPTIAFALLPGSLRLPGTPLLFLSLGAYGYLLQRLLRGVFCAAPTAVQPIDGPTGPSTTVVCKRPFL